MYTVIPAVFRFPVSGHAPYPDTRPWLYYIHISCISPPLSKILLKTFPYKLKMSLSCIPITCLAS